MDLRKISRLVDLLQQRTLVGDGQLPLICHKSPSPIDCQDLYEYKAFLIDNTKLIDDLRQEMTEEELRAAEVQFQAWFSRYLQEE
jgi:hypothetical protein